MQWEVVAEVEPALSYAEFIALSPAELQGSWEIRTDPAARSFMLGFDAFLDIQEFVSWGRFSLSGNPTFMRFRGELRTPDGTIIFPHPDGANSYSLSMHLTFTKKHNLGEP